jgi:hypothetical protein
MALALLVAAFQPAAANPVVGKPVLNPPPSGYLATFFGLTPGGDVYGLQLNPDNGVLIQTAQPVWHHDDLKTIITGKYALSFYALTSSNQLYLVNLFDKTHSFQPFVKPIQNDFLTAKMTIAPGAKQQPGASGSASTDPVAFTPVGLFGCHDDGIYEILSNGNLLRSTVTGSFQNTSDILSASKPVLVGTGWQTLSQVGCGGQIDMGTRGFHIPWDAIYGIAKKDDPYKAYKKGDLRFYMYEANKKIWHVYNAGFNFGTVPTPRLVVGEQILLTSRRGFTGSKPSLVQSYIIADSTADSSPEMWNWTLSASDRKAGPFAGADLHNFTTIIFDSYEPAGLH